MVPIGRTLNSYRQTLESEKSRWKTFRDALREHQSRNAFDQLWESAFNLADAGSTVLRPVIFDTILFSMLLRLSKELEQQNRRYEEIRLELADLKEGMKEMSKTLSS